MLYIKSDSGVCFATAKIRVLEPMDILDHDLMGSWDYKEASKPANNKRLKKKPFVRTH